jgi:hypothetical protein
MNLMKPLFVALAAATALLIASTASLQATTYVTMSDQDMTQSSDAIVVGRVTQTRSQWIGKQLVTIANVQISETLKGDAKPTMEVILPGGVDTKRRVPVAMTYAGAPTLRRNEEVLLFVERTELRPNAMVISGFSQGKYNVVLDKSGTAMVTRGADGKSLRSAQLSIGNNDRRTLAEFRREINSYLAKPKR